MIHVTQLERDTILVCLDREFMQLDNCFNKQNDMRFIFKGLTVCSLFPVGCIKIVNLEGKLKSSKKLSAELTFNFQIEAIGKPP